MINTKLAKEISIAKWESELDGNVGPYYTLLKQYRKDYPTLTEHHSCGFCLRHGFSYSTHENRTICNNCELANSAAKCCLNNDSLYNLIEEEYSGTERDDAIRELIDIIKSIREDE